ncbi:MAG: type II secretion system F family protein [Firmicutes bacterium]|nr:type II secretion system F family protein [Bacillota bacterium]
MNSGIIRKIYRVKDIENIQNKINMLGTNRKIKFDAVSFLNTRLITTILLTIILILFSNIQYFIIPFILIIYYNLFYYFLITDPINKRIKKLDLEALTFFEILTLTLESGRNLENSLEITCYNIDSELSNEFKRSLMEMKFGRSLMETLEDLKKRIPSETINNILLNITQTNIFGNSIIETMNNQVEYLREKQMMEVKSQINKIPNKVSIISVIFIIPLILLIILGPFIIELL